MTDETTSSSDAFVWQDPPAAAKTGRKTGRWKVAVGRLQERPGEWAIVGTFSNDSAHATAYRLKKIYGCETTTRANGDGTTAIYARWPKEAS